MTTPDTGSSLGSWLDTLDDDDLRELLDSAMIRFPDLADWLDAQRAAASDDPGELLTVVNRDLSAHRHSYDYWQANRYAEEAAATVELIADRARQATPGLLPVIERAITLTTRAILRSDDSSGLQGDLVHTLLDAHATAVRTTTPTLTQQEQTRLVKWIVKYRYGGKQDFFDPDIVAYAPGLSTKSVEQYRTAISKVDLGPYGRYPLQRLAVLSRNRDVIIAAHGGEPENHMLAASLVWDLEEAGLHQDAVTYARLGVARDGRGWDPKLITFLVEDALDRDAGEEAVQLRRDWFARFSSHNAFTSLRATAEHVGVWERERADAEGRLAKHDPAAFARYLVSENRSDEAWDYASAHLDVATRRDVWVELCARRATTRPADTLPVYREIILGTLVVTDKRNYRVAANLLQDLRTVASSVGPDAEHDFTQFLAKVVDQNKRRPTCIDAFRRAKLIQ